MIRKGDRIVYKPEWRDPGDEHITFVALEDEDGGRVRVGALLDGWDFVPNQVVLVDWIERHHALL